MITEKAKSIVELDARLAEEKLKNLTTQSVKLREEINRLNQTPATKLKSANSKKKQTQTRRLKKETQDTSFVLKNSWDSRFEHFGYTGIFETVKRHVLRNV